MSNSKITDVAAKAGVAKSTVSNVLTGKKFVSEELKQKVLAACEELDFHPNFYASGLSSHKSNIIALLLENPGDMDLKFYQKLIVACLKQAAKSNYSLLLYYNPDEDKIINTLRQGMAPIDGAVVMSPCVNDERLRSIESGMINCVAIGRPEGCGNISYVDIDNVKLVKDVTAKLISDFGSDVYLINSDPRMTISVDRNKAFKSVCLENSVDPASRIRESHNSSMEEGYAIAKEILHKGGAYITANGALAAGIYSRAKETGLVIGKDIAVFALGRSIDHGSFYPKLSYADQDYELLGKTAVDILISEIERGTETRKVFIESKIIFTESIKNS